ncbi:MFS transporter [Rhodobaculum claviforme]|uniref:MFS transporter n=1 Tax=Rhodobaculum claviforme TaxID=1549854 RepID=A0A934TLU3_9RHOB|nr:MFS transporter [Rhodobaculum claviforme]MBK5928504.1 MFS transporter [Rhodobaculum claviforme]
MRQFLIANRHWLGFGFLLTFASAFGQTWFISLFAGDIKDRFGLTDGGWGLVYTVATLASAALLLSRGGVADTVRPARLAPLMALGFAASGLAFAFTPGLWVLMLALVGLRFCGQGMFSHMAMTAMGRWFRARRGRAVSIANLGHSAGEAVLPIVAVALIAALGWQATWVLVAGVLVLAVAPALATLGRERTAQSAAVATEAPGMGGRHWTRADALRHWLFPALLPILLTPGFIGTVVFFHQVHIAEVKGWTLAQMAPGYVVFAVLSVVSGLAAGWAADRFGPHRLLVGLLVPTGLGVALIGPAEAVGTWFVALGLIGMTQGIGASLWGAFWPAVYGTRNLGSVRALATVVMVVSTAIGPGLTGLLIDAGIDFPAQGLGLGIWCAGLCVLALAVQSSAALGVACAPRAASENAD